MLYRLAIVAALGLAALTASADAQVPQVLASCGSASIPLGPGGKLYVDQTGNLCTANVTGWSGGSVTAGGTSGTQAQAVQGIPNGVPQNVNLLATTTAGPTPGFTLGGAALVGKASPGNLYGFSVTAGTTAGYLAIINATAAPAASAAIAPMECIPVPVNGYVARRQDIPDRYTVGVVALFTSSCQTYTAVSPQVISLVVQ